MREREQSLRSKRIRLASASWIGRESPFSRPTKHKSRAVKLCFTDRRRRITLALSSTGIRYTVPIDITGNDQRDRAITGKETGRGGQGGRRTGGDSRSHSRRKRERSKRGDGTCLRPLSSSAVLRGTKERRFVQREIGFCG